MKLQIFQQISVKSSCHFLYILENGKPAESFWTCMTLQDYNAHILAESIKQDLLDKTGDDKNKLNSCSYDEANVMRDQYGGAMKELGKSTQVHTLCIVMNLVITNTISQNKDARISFASSDNMNRF